MDEGMPGRSFSPFADDAGRVPYGQEHRARSSGRANFSRRASSIRKRRSHAPVSKETLRIAECVDTDRTRAGSGRGGCTPGAAVLSVRLLASERDIEDTLPLALAAHREGRHRRYRLDAERRRRFLRERFLADPTRYGFLVARHRGRAVGMLTCHAQTLFYSDATVVSCLSFYVSGSVRRTLLGGRVALGLLDAGRRWALNRRAVEWQVHVTNGIHIGQTDRMLRRVGFRQTGGNYAMGLVGEGER